MTDQATREAAADLIDTGMSILAERGWCQGNFRAADGRVCVLESLMQAQDRLRASGSVFECVHAAFLAETGGVPMMRFNDELGTTESDVKLTMKRASHSLRDGAL